MANAQIGTVSHATMRNEDLIPTFRDLLVELDSKSENAKTGDMVGLYVLPIDESPTESIKHKRDALQCGDCPLKRSICYVNPVTVNGPHRTTHNMPVSDVPEKFDKPVRLGVYGEPALVPLSLLAKICERAPKHTGYTHQWHKRSVKYSRFLMASIDNVMAAVHKCTPLELKRKANAKGYRTFRVVAPDQQIDTDEIECPYTRGVQCADCGLCNGTYTGSERKNIYITIHGPQNKVKTYLK